MVTTEQIIEEVKEMKKDSGIKGGRVTLVYSEPEVEYDVDKILKETGAETFQSRFVTDQSQGRFLSVDYRSKNDRKVTVYCTQEFQKKLV